MLDIFTGSLLVRILEQSVTPANVKTVLLNVRCPLMKQLLVGALANISSVLRLAGKQNENSTLSKKFKGMHWCGHFAAGTSEKTKYEPVIPVKVIDGSLKDISEDKIVHSCVYWLYYETVFYNSGEVACHLSLISIINKQTLDPHHLFYKISTWNVSLKVIDRQTFLPYDVALC